MKNLHTGGCHCGAVRYEATIDLDHCITCNCSLCQKAGTMLAFVPESDFKLLSGQDDLKDYQFNKKVIHHYFCTTCGVRSFGRGANAAGEKTYAINVRCLDDVDPTTLSPTHYDGKSA